MKPGRMGGFDMNAMMKQAQKLQAEMEKKQAELREREFTATAGGGVVSATVCDRRIKALTIAPDVVDPDDIEMLADLITAAVNDAMNQCDEATASEMGKLTGGIGGGLF